MNLSPQNRNYFAPTWNIWLWLQSGVERYFASSGENTTVFRSLVINFLLQLLQLECAKSLSGIKLTLSQRLLAFLLYSVRESKNISGNKTAIKTQNYVFWVWLISYFVTLQLIFRTSDRGAFLEDKRTQYIQLEQQQWKQQQQQHEQEQQFSTQMCDFILEW